MPDFGKAKVMFYTEGNPIALLVSRKAGRQAAGAKPVKSALAALTWCKANGVVLIYLPVPLNQN